MVRKPERKGLGRGLSALLGDVEETRVPVTGATPAPAAGPATSGLASVAIDLIDRNPEQPRRDFPETELDELASSIRERGIIQPIIVRPHPARAGAYEIVAGERRWRAAQRAQLHEVPVVIRSLDDRDVLELAIIENVQRSDLNAVDEARGYAQLIEKFSYTQEDLARTVGKSRSHLANTMRLLSLPEPVLAMLRSGDLTAGHARTLIPARDPVALARKVVAGRLSVRQTEQLVKAEASAPRPKPRPVEKDADTRVLEGDLSAAIGMAVKIEHRAGDAAGEMRIRYKDLEDLDRLCQRLSGF